MADFLDAKRDELRARLAELAPLVAEHDRLKRALEALDAVDGSGAATPSPVPTPTGPAKGDRPKGRPQRTERSRPRAVPPPAPEEAAAPGAPAPTPDPAPAPPTAAPAPRAAPDPPPATDAAPRPDPNAPRAAATPGSVAPTTAGDAPTPDPATTADTDAAPRPAVDVGRANGSVDANGPADASADVEPTTVDAIPPVGAAGTGSSFDEDWDAPTPIGRPIVVEAPDEDERDAAMRVVREEPGLPATEIARRIGLPPHDAYRILPGLEEAGLAEKQGRGWHPTGA